MIARITDPDILAGYLTDASNTHGHADVLVRPRTTAEVAEVVAHCQAQNIPLTITAARTSTTGGPVPDGGWLLSTELLSEIVHIGHDRATAGAGVFLGAFQAACEAQGRLFPPDPTSRHECTLGAAIACNASGARAFKYGATRPWIEAVEVVLPDGTVMQVERGDPIPADWPVPHWVEPDVKTAAGYAPATDLLDLMIGQEGTLGVITRATVRLTDLPDQVIGFLFYFPSRQDAVHCTTDLRNRARHDPRGLVSPRAIEYLDEACLAFARERVGDVPVEARCALFCEQELLDDMDNHLEAWLEALTVHTGELIDDAVLAYDDATTRALHALRHAVPAGINEQVVRNGMPKVGTDLAVPDDRLSEVMDLYETCPLPHATFGHIGDNHLHCNVLPTTDAELSVAKDWYNDVAHLVIAMGGTVSAEHGIGKLKRALLAAMVGPDVIAQFQALKRHLDPNWILGRGTLLHIP